VQQDGRQAIGPKISWTVPAASGIITTKRIDQIYHIEFRVSLFELR